MIKDGNSYTIITHKEKSKISLVSANQAKKLINYSKKYVFILLIETSVGGVSIGIHKSVQGA
jgi:hypothetical protein